MKLGFIGAGNMGSALISACLGNGYPAKDLIVSVNTEASRSRLSTCFAGVQFMSNQQVAAECDVLFLAVKPFIMPIVMQDIAATLQAHPKLIVSVATGLMLDYYAEHLGSDCPVVRAMPNTPVQVGFGFTGLLANQAVQADHKEWVTQLFSQLGDTTWVQTDDAIDQITALSGSGPAYFFYLFDAMHQVAMDMGFDPKTAKHLTLKTVEGALQLSEKSEQSFLQLRQAVTAKRGTTEAALSVLEAGSVQYTFQKAIVAAYNRARVISSEHNK